MEPSTIGRHSTRGQHCFPNQLITRFHNIDPELGTRVSSYRTLTGCAVVLQLNTTRKEITAPCTQTISMFLQIIKRTLPRLDTIAHLQIIVSSFIVATFIRNAFGGTQVSAPSIHVSVGKGFIQHRIGTSIFWRSRFLDVRGHRHRPDREILEVRPGWTSIRHSINGKFTTRHHKGLLAYCTRLTRAATSRCIARMGFKHLLGASSHDNLHFWRTRNDISVGHY
mmetsp:Transcript_44173/g.64938  ORF Transcript_44173/g.64938 Transcript_44173/m.64938 type:complete len:224 (+) Transcript_44173:3646-4317(+)